MIIMYATTKDGEGFVTPVGNFESCEDIEVRCGMYAADVVITFENKSRESETKD